MINIKPKERSYNDVTPTVAPVSDTSAASRMSGVAQTIGAIGSIASTVWEVQQREAAQEEGKRQVGLENNYIEGLNSLSVGIEQGKLSGVKLGTALSQLEQRLLNEGLTREKMLELQTKHGKSLRGKVLEGGTLEDQIVASEDKELTTLGFFHPGQSVEDRDEIREDYRLSQAESRKNEAKAKKLALRAAELSVDATEKAVVKQKQFELAQEELINLGNNQLSLWKNNLLRMQQKYTSGEYSSSATGNEALYLEDLAAFRAKEMRKINTAIQQFPEKLKANSELIIKSFDDLYTVAKDSFSSATFKGIAENQYNTAIAQTRNAIINSDPKMAAWIATAPYLKTLTTAQQTDLTNGVVNYISSLEGGEDTPPGKEVRGGWYKFIAEAINKQQTPVDTDETALTPSPEQIDTQMGAVIDFFAQGAGKDNSETVEFLSGLGKDSSTTPGNLKSYFSSSNIDPEILAKAENSFMTFREDMFDEVRVALDEALPPAVKSNLPPTGEVRVTQEEVDAEIVGNRFKFTPLTPNARFMSDKLTRRFGSGITKYLTAFSNVYNISLKEAWDLQKEDAWGSKYAEQEKQAATYPDNEGMIGTDTDGNQFIILSGEPVPYKGGADGT